MTVRRASAVGALLVAVASTGGCDLINSDSGLGRNITIRNDTAETIVVFQVRDGIESILITLEPAQTHRMRADLVSTGCLPDPLVARSEDGDLIAEHPAALCIHEEWAVETTEAAPQP